MIRLTIAHYYTPAGRCIQKPYEKGKQKDYAEDMLARLKSGELMSADSVHFNDSLKYYTLREHRVVYGGGGIMPDEFVPLDTTKYTRFHRELIAEGKKQKITPKDDAELQRTLPYLSQQLKALVARDLWSMNEYFAVMNEQSDIVQRALQLIEK